MEHKKIEYVHIIRAAKHRAWKVPGVKLVALIVGREKNQQSKYNSKYNKEIETNAKNKSFLPGKTRRNLETLLQNLSSLTLYYFFKLSAYCLMRQ